MSESSKDENSALGKRKRDRPQGRDVSSNSPGSTFFVSNLPYTCTSTDLQTLFSDIAPVRSAFVVLENGVSKGVGYVSFAIREDAGKAMETLQEKGIDLNGRKLRVEWADAKRKDKDKDPVQQEKTKMKPAMLASHPSAPKVERDPNAIRTIIISGLPASMDSKVLWKKIRKFEGSEKIEFLNEKDGTAHALFKTPAAASHAVEKLHAHIFKGSLLSAVLKKRVESVAKVKYAAGGGQSNASVITPSRASRLIVRNLPWDISEHDLRALFLPYGPIHSIHVPRLMPVEKGKQPRARGFAFVWYVSKKDAEHGMEAVNGRAVRAGAISAPTMNKKERARLRRRLRADADAGKDDDDDEDKEDETDKEDEAPSGERIIAVDWALSKDKWEEAKMHMVPDAGVDEKELRSASQEAEDQDMLASEESDDEMEDDDGEEAIHDSAETDEEGAVDIESDGDGNEQLKPSLPQTDIGTTLFVRNIPFEATEDDLRILFRAFGPLRYARITFDPETGRSRGTGFACFWNKEHADQAIEQSEMLRKETGGENTRKNPFSMPSILTPDPSSSLAKSLVLHGRTLDVVRAVTRHEAGVLKEEGEKRREKADKRNMYLLREGVILPNTPAAAHLSAKELDDRATSFNTRRNLLKTNPSLFVSRTRLSIRNLPLFTTEHALKKLAKHAIKAFEKEVKEGKRDPLSAEERLKEADRVDNEENDQRKEAPNGGKRTKKRKLGLVRQAKVVRQAGRIDAMTGKSRSRGYGFLELEEHCDSLRVLRWANSNPEVSSLLELWWSEELEEMVKMAEKSPLLKSQHKEDAESEQSRLKRLKDELHNLKDGQGRRSNKRLIIEFSIENIQVVNRRKELQSQKIDTSFKKREQASTLGARALDPGAESESEGEEQQRSSKLARVSADGIVSHTAKDVSETRKIQELIGRKRKERKARQKG